MKLDDAPDKLEPDLRPPRVPVSALIGDELMHETENTYNSDRTTVGDRHERMMKALMMLGEAVERLDTKLGDVLLPEPTSPMSGEMRDKYPEKPRTSRLQEQHTQTLEMVLAQARKLEGLLDRIDL